MEVVYKVLVVNLLSTLFLAQCAPPPLKYPGYVPGAL